MSEQLQHFGLNGANQGLNGFWGRLWKSVADRMAASGTTMGALIAGIMDAVSGGCGKMSDRVACRTAILERDYVLTDQENTQVIAWADAYFSPFYNTIIKKVDGIFQDGVTLDQQIAIINEAISKMSVFKAYLMTNPNNFSINANKEQFNGVSEFFDYVDEAIIDIIYGSDVVLEKYSVGVDAVGMDFQPFTINKINTTAELYKIGNTGVVSPTVVLSTPVATTAGTTNPATEKSWTAVKVILGGVAAFFLIKSFTKKE